MTNGSLIKVESIAECSPWSILQYFWPALSNNWSWKPNFGIFESGRFTQVLLYFQFLATEKSKQVYAEQMPQSQADSWHPEEEASEHRQTKTHPGLKLRVLNRRITFLVLNQNICCGYSNEMVLLCKQNICKNVWVRKYLQFYAEIFCLPKPVHVRKSKNTIKVASARDDCKTGEDKELRHKTRKKH